MYCNMAWHMEISDMGGEGVITHKYNVILGAGCWVLMTGIPDAENTTHDIQD